MRAVERARRRTSAGQSLVEFSLLAIALIVLLVGAAQVGSIVFSHIAVQTAAREAARVASTEPYTTLGPAYSGGTQPCLSSSAPGGCAAAYSSTNQAFGGLDSTKFAVTYSACTFAGNCASSLPICTIPTGSQSPSDGWITFTVTYRAPVYIPLLGMLLADPGRSYRTVSSSVTMRIEPCSMTLGS